MKSLMNVKTIPFLWMLSILLLTQCRSKREEVAVESAEPAAVSVGSVAKGDYAATETDASVATDLAAPPPPIPPAAPTVDKSISDSIGKKIIKDGTITWETGNLKSTNAWLKKLASQHQAYIANESSSSNDYRTDYSMEVRLPAEQFDQFIAALENEVSDFDTKNITAQDVTEEYIDVYARIKTKKELEQRYFAILNKANKVDDILKTEEYLNNVRNEIESAEGRMRYLNDRINLSTLHLNFYQTSKVSHGFGRDIFESFSDGWKGILNFILVLIRLWPILLIIGAIVFWFIRRRKNRLIT